MRSVRFLIIVAAVGMLGFATTQAATRLVLLEEATQWNCPPCSQVNPYLKPFLDANKGSIIGIRYHGAYPDYNDDPMYLWDSKDHSSRYQYYSVSGEPTTVFDGIIESGSPSTESNATTNANNLSTRLGVATPLTLTVTETVNGSVVTVNINAASTAALTGNYKLRVAVVKEVVDSMVGASGLIPTAGGNGEKSFENVVQRMLPNAGGTAFSISANGQQSFQFTYNTNEILPGNSSNVFVVAWVQNDDTKEVVNAGMDNGFYFINTVPAPITKVAAADATNTFTVSVPNRLNASATFTANLTSLHLPASWQASYTVNGQTFTDTSSVTVAAHATATYQINYKMTGGKGIASGAFNVLQKIGDTLYTSVTSIYAASSDVQTVIVSASGDDSISQRVISYQNVLQASGYPYATFQTGDANIIALNDSAIKNMIYIGGCGIQVTGSLNQDVPPVEDLNMVYNFASKGGNILFTSGTMASVGALYNQYYGITTYVSFMQNVLHTNWVGEISSLYNVEGLSDTLGVGVTSSPLVNVFTDLNNGMYYGPDVITASDNSATNFLRYVTGSSHDSICGVRYQGNGYKSVYVSYCPEAMTDATSRAALINNVMKWFGEVPIPTLQVTAPAPSAVWPAKSLHFITWTSSNVTSVDISYSIDGGTTWTSIITGKASGAGTYAWNVPDVNSTNCYVKVASSGSETPVSESGPFTIQGSSAVNENGAIASNFDLMQNYPNPFDGTTNIQFTLPHDEQITLTIYDMKGTLVTSLANGLFRSGANSVVFDATALPSGTYEYRLKTPNGTLTHLMSLVKH